MEKTFARDSPNSKSLPGRWAGLPSQSIGSLSMSTGWCLTVFLMDDETSSLTVDIACAMDGEEDVTARATTFDRGDRTTAAKSCSRRRVRVEAWVSTFLKKKSERRLGRLHLVRTPDEFETRARVPEGSSGRAEEAHRTPDTILQDSTCVPDESCDPPLQTLRGRTLRMIRSPAHQCPRHKGGLESRTTLRSHLD